MKKEINTNGINEREYIAFISYRHIIPDKTVARILHSKLEHYRVPKEYREAHGSDRLGYVFRDEEELPASSNLSESIKHALDNSKFLIVVCTPKTKESMWVLREIDYFLENHPRENALAVLVEGSPDTSFPPSLLWTTGPDGSKEQVEPLAANITDKDHHYRPGRLKRETFRLCAAMLGCPFDTLWQRERRYRQKRVTVTLAAALGVMSCFLGVVMLQNARIASKNRQIAADNVRIEEDIKNIEEKNRQINEQFDEIKNQNAEILMREGRLLLEKGDRAGAVKSAGEAVTEGSSDAAVAAGAEALLTEALGVYDVSGRFRAERVLSQETDIVSMVISTDGNRVFTTDETGVIRCFDTNDSELKWTYRTGWDAKVWDSEAMSNPCSLEKISDKTPGVLICHTYRHVCAVDAAEGKLLWSIDSDESGEDSFSRDTEGDIYCASDPHGKGTVLMDEDTKNGGLRLRLVDNASGEVVKTAEAPVNDRLSGKYVLSGSGMRIAMNNGAFSDDGAYFACVFMLEDKDDAYSNAGAESYCIWDLETGEAKCAGTDIITYPRYSPLLGISFCNDDKELNLYRYEWNEDGILAVHVKADGSSTKERVPQPIKNSLNSSDEELKNRYLFLPGKQYTAVGVNDSWHVFRNADNKNTSSRNEGCDIVSFFWEEDGQRLGCLLENGGYANAGWGGESGYMLSWGYGVSMGQLRKVVSTGPIDQGDNEGEEERREVDNTVLAAVRSTSASQIVIFKMFTDPGAKLCDFDITEYLSGIRAKMEEEAGDWEPAGDESFGLKDDYFELLKSRGNRILERTSPDGRYMAVVSDGDGSTMVLDVERGELVYEDRVASCDENILIVNYDEAAKRLYIFDGFNLHCIDTESYEALFVKDYCQAYLPEEGTLIISAGDGNNYYRVPIYSRDELVDQATGTVLLAR
ncbi:MAG: TIR domain-containing protein [Lachnospiraceae bacterium]|nr:TIR domain-containing protein [Lachnospiraceae bacterium]